MKDTETALKWIVEILNKNKSQFQISGGFAARLYGSSRELADIDIEVTNDCFEIILPKVKNHVIFGPKQYIDENWNLKLMTLEYKGQYIDIAGEAKIFDQNLKQWIEQRPDFNNSNKMIVYDIIIPVITKEALITYKSKLLRKVDKEDVRFLMN